MITQVILIYKSTRYYDWQLKMVQKGLKKIGFSFHYDGTPDLEKKSSVIKVKKNVSHTV